MDAGEEKGHAGWCFAEAVEGAGVVAMAGQEGDKKPGPKGVPKRSRKVIGGSGGSGLVQREGAKQVRVCGGVQARDLYGSLTEHAGDTEAEPVMVHCTILLPARCRSAETRARHASPLPAHRTVPLPLSPALRGWRLNAQRILRKRGF